IEARWIGILKTHFGDKSLDQLFGDKKFPRGFIEDTEALAQDIKAAFSAMAKKPILDGLFTRENIAMVEAVEKARERLMVRSSGREDTKTLANAGGNESKSNVLPQFEEIFLSLGDVVASYFETRSLTQRLAARDPSLLDPVPFTPVIIQRMIGEKD